MLWELLLNPPSYIKPGKAVKWLHYPLGFSTLKEMHRSPFYPCELWFWSGAGPGCTQGCLRRGAQANPPSQVHEGAPQRCHTEETTWSYKHRTVKLIFCSLKGLRRPNDPTFVSFSFRFNPTPRPYFMPDIIGNRLYRFYIAPANTHVMFLCYRKASLIIQCQKHWAASSHSTCVGLPIIWALRITLCIRQADTPNVMPSDISKLSWYRQKETLDWVEHLM